ncbi:MAG TPA: PIG-L family deacetylase, partial [Bacteroidota bacterium]
MKIRNLVVLALFSILPFGGMFGQSPRALSSSEIQLALKKLTVVGSALYVAAHPDDENTALLSYLAKGRHVRAAYLSMTRGEGGQNLIGSEQGDLMGIIRTQELLAARRMDGAEQFFSRAIDFGYSKNSEETIQIWGHDTILSDVVWVIRSFRPDVIMTRFSPTAGGHGNHTGSAVFAEEAFHAAGDPSKFPEQLRFVQPWKPKRILFNTFRPTRQQLDTDSLLKVDVGEYNSLLGMSYSEIAGISRSMHKSQGFGASQSRGSQIHYFSHTAGEPATNDLFDGVNLAWSRMPGGEPVGRLLEQAYASFKPEQPSASVPLLLQAYSAMKKLESNVWLEAKKAELLNALKACAGIWVDALAATYSAAPGSEVRDSVIIVKRSDVPVVVESVRFPFSENAVSVNQSLENNKLWHQSNTMKFPQDMPYTQPYWLQQERPEGSYIVSDQLLVSRPENPPALAVRVTLKFDNERIELTVPIRYRWVDPVEGELYRQMEIVPPVAATLHERIHVFRDGGEKTISATLRSGIPNASGEVRLVPPDGWVSKPSSIPFRLERKGEEMNVSFTVGREASMSNGAFRLEVLIGGKVVSQGIHTVDYDHIPPQTTFPPAEGKLVNLDLKLKGTNIGYITGSGDDVPTGLRQVGYSVTLLSDEDVATSD